MGARNSSKRPGTSGRRTAIWNRLTCWLRRTGCLKWLISGVPVRSLTRRRAVRSTRQGSGARRGTWPPRCSTGSRIRWNIQATRQTCLPAVSSCTTCAPVKNPSKKQSAPTNNTAESSAVNGIYSGKTRPKYSQSRWNKWYRTYSTHLPLNDMALKMSTSFNMHRCRCRELRVKEERCEWVGMVLGSTILAPVREIK